MNGLSNLNVNDFDPQNLPAPGTQKIVGRKRETAQLAPLNHAAFAGKNGSQMSNY